MAVVGREGRESYEMMHDAPQERCIFCLGVALSTRSESSTVSASCCMAFVVSKASRMRAAVSSESLSCSAFFVASRLPLYTNGEREAREAREVRWRESRRRGMSNYLEPPCLSSALFWTTSSVLDWC